MTPVAMADIWRERHQQCADTPLEITSLDEARYVLTAHAGHDGTCMQFAAALRHVSTVP